MSQIKSLISIMLTISWLLICMREFSFAQSEESLPPPPMEFKFEAPNGYEYDPRSRRDPFRPYGIFFENQVIQTKVGAVESTNPILDYDIDQLSVVAILWEVENPRALIRDPLGKTHIVRGGDKLGNLGGKVAAIREGEIVVIEQRTNGNKMEKTPRVMSIRR